MSRSEGQPMYHYTECGLDNVWLVGGYHIEATDYGETVSIFDTIGLNSAIGECLVSSQRILTGAEFRFLRLELDLSQRQLAGLINADEQAVRRWEKERSKPVKGPGERMMRVLYLAWATHAPIRASIERLAELDVLAHQERQVVRLDAEDKVWRPDCCRLLSAAASSPPKRRSRARVPLQLAV